MERARALVKLPWNLLKLLFLFLLLPSKRVLAFLLLCSLGLSLFLTISLQKAKQELDDLTTMTDGLFDELSEAKEKQQTHDATLNALLDDTTFLKKYLRIIATPTPEQ